MKRMEGLPAESLIITIKVIFAEYGILHRLMSDADQFYFRESQKFLE